MTKEEVLKLGQELDKTNSTLNVRLSKNDYYEVLPLYTGIGRNQKVAGIVIAHWYARDGHLQPQLYHSTLNDDQEVLKDFEAAIETDKYEIKRESFNHRNY